MLPAPSRAFVLVLLVTLTVLLLVPTGGTRPGKVGSAAPSGVTLGTAAPTVLAIDAAPHPAACSSSDTTPFSLSFVWRTVGLNGSTNTSLLYNGSLPANVSGDLVIGGPVATYNWGMAWLDGSIENGTVAKITDSPYILTLNHSYALAGQWSPSFDVELICPNSISSYGQSVSVQVFGPCGPNELLINASTWSTPTAFGANYTSQICGLPSMNMNVQWFAFYSDGSSQESPLTTIANLTAWDWNATLTLPGAVSTVLQISYPNGTAVPGALWDSGWAPVVRVPTQALLSIAYTPLTGGSPWNLTFWGNATDLNGTPYNGSASVEWNFAAFDRSPSVWETGPTVGSPIWHEFFLNGTYTGFGESAYAYLVDTNGTILGWASVPILLTNNPGGGSAATLALTVSPNNGTAPLNTMLTLTFGGVNLSGGPYGVIVVAFNASGASQLLLNDTHWTALGAPVSVAANFSTPGVYQVRALAGLWATGGGSFIALANASAVVTVAAPTTVNSPTVALSVGVAPGNQSAGASVVIDVAATGGTLPYQLTACGGSPAALANGSCTPLMALTNWSGASTTSNPTINATGNYSVVATLVDAAGRNANASTLVHLPGVPPVAAPLTVRASVSPVASSGLAAASYDFLATVTGGNTPYTLQWAFGDGSLGSTTPGGTTRHAYLTGGSYFATLTVTDARGAVASTTVGPLVVARANGSGPFWVDPGVQVIAVGVTVGALIAIAILGRRAAQHKEAVNWRRTLEPSEAGGEPGHRRQ